MGADQSGRETGRLFALSQVGLEMVVPVAVGLYLDKELNWSPWGVVGGTVIGLFGGLAHLLLLLRRFEEKDSSKRQDGP